MRITVRITVRITAAASMMVWAMGCGASPPTVADATGARLAVLAVGWQTRDPLPSLDAREPLMAGMRTVPSVTVVPIEPEPACEADDAECARRAGRAVRADRVVMSSMAALGETVLARVSVVDVRAGTREETRQRVVRGVRGVSAARVRAALRELGELVVAPYAPARETPWYEEAWVWGVAGAVVVGAAVAIGLGLGLSSPEGPNVVVTPP